jgi:hypothetical protein
MAKQPADQLDTGERKAIEDVVAKAMGTPRPTSISSDALKVAIDERCAECRKPSGSIGELWAEFNPIRKYVWMVMGAVAILAVVVGITVPRINSKLDALDEMAKDMAVMKVQVNWILLRGGHTEAPAPNPKTYAANAQQGTPTP